MQVKFITESQSFNVALNQTETAKRFFEILPVESVVQAWGEEIYFNIGQNLPFDCGTMDLEIGDVAYWPEGDCICVFFGKTPMSNSDKPVPASSVVIIGNTEEELEKLSFVQSGEKIKVV